VNKSELINAISESASISKVQAERALAGLLQSVQDALSSGQEVALPNLGKFVVGQRGARTGRNPQTGATIEIAASRTVQFKAAAPLKRAVNG
jgi:DNA-binding protein HU-beta